MQALKGLCLALLSGIFFSVVGVIVKQMKNIHPEQLSLYRFIFIFCFSLPQTVLIDSPIAPKKYRLLLILRGLAGGTGLSLSFLAFRYLPLGEANVIVFSAPIFVTIFARFYMKESCGAIQVIAVLFTLIGIVLITKIPQLAESGAHASYTTENLYGLLAAFGAVIINVCRFIILRKLKCVHQAIVMFNFGWIAMLETTILTALISGFKLQTCGLQPFLIIILGLFSYIEQLLLTMAMKYEQAGPVATARAATDITAAFLWQTFFFHEMPDACSISGAILVSFSVVLVGLRKWALSLPKDSTISKYLI